MTTIYTVRKHVNDIPRIIVTDEYEAQAYADSGWIVDESVLQEETPRIIYLAFYGGIILAGYLFAGWLFGYKATTITFLSFGLAYFICWIASRGMDNDA